jgi:uncharacterized SAM-dependent methyltransferase
MKHPAAFTDAQRPKPARARPAEPDSQGSPNVSSEPKEGIKHLPLKKNAIVILTKQTTARGLVNWVLTDQDERWANTIEQIRQNVPGLWSSKWGTTRPTDPEYVKFLDALVTKLDIGNKNGHWFRSVSFVDFVRALPREKQSLVEHLLPEGQTLIPYAKIESLLLHIKAHPEASAQAVMKGLQAGTIEQKFCYTSPESALRWYKFISDPAYRQTRECTRALEEFINERGSNDKPAAWQAYLRTERLKGVVVLGGGSPSKDQMIFRSMLATKGNQPGTHLHFSIVDFSHFMALETLLALEETVEYDKRRIEIRAVCADFENLDDRAQRDIRPNNNDGLAWFMLGGTLGNLNEEKFFRSIRDASLRGDWLIIGIETVDEHVDPDAKQRIIDKYQDNHELQQFFYAPLMAGWHSRRAQHAGRAHAQHAADIDEALKCPDVQLLSIENDETGRYVKVPSSHSLVVRVTVNDEVKTILKSTRYHERSLVEYARHYQFRFIKSVPSPDNAAYKILIFERVKRAETEGSRIDHS